MVVDHCRSAHSFYLHYPKRSLQVMSQNPLYFSQVNKFRLISSWIISIAIDFELYRYALTNITQYKVTVRDTLGKSFQNFDLYKDNSSKYTLLISVTKHDIYSVIDNINDIHINFIM